MQHDNGPDYPCDRKMWYLSITFRSLFHSNPGIEIWQKVKLLKRNNRKHVSRRKLQNPGQATASSSWGRHQWERDDNKMYEYFTSVNNLRQITINYNVFQNGKAKLYIFCLAPFNMNSPRSRSLHPSLYVCDVHGIRSTGRTSRGLVLCNFPKPSTTSTQSIYTYYIKKTISLSFRLKKGWKCIWI